MLSFLGAATTDHRTNRPPLNAPAQPRLRRLAATIGALLALAVLPVASASAQTTVSLTFDDGAASQYVARSMLATHGMHGTFFVNSDKIGLNPYYMTWSQIHDLAADGNEIGGHTLDQVDLTTATPAEAQRQVCDDRTNLIGRGYSVSTFAYPFSRFNTAVQAIVQQCGYTVARRQGGLFDATECAGCPYSNAIPPSNPYVVRAPEWLPRAYTLADFEGWVTQAEAHGGGWVPVIVGDVCNACGSASVSQADLQAFLDWLQARQAQGTVVKTLREVTPPADAAPPQTAISCDGAACTTNPYTSQTTVGLSATDSGSGVSSTHYTTDGSEPTTQSATYTAPITLTASTTIRFRSWDSAGNVEATQSQAIQIVASPPPPAPTTVSLTFDDGAASQYGARSLLASHGMHGTFFINSNKVASNSYYMNWGQIHDLAADGNEIGGHTLDHIDLTAATPAEVQRQVCGDRSNLVAQGFSVSSFAYPFSKSNAAVEATVQQCGYASARRIGGLFDAADCLGCPYANTPPLADPYFAKTPPWETRPFTLQDLEGWVTQAQAHGGGWVPLVFHDICAGCAESSVSQGDLQAFLDWLQTRDRVSVKTVNEVVPPLATQPDTTATATAIACNGTSCSAGWYRATVSVTLAASDGGSGVAATRYTTDGSDPTAQSPAYTGPISVKATTTIKFRSWDAAGNAEPTQSQLIQIDVKAPVTTIACNNGSGCSTGWYKAAVNVSLTASDTGSGVAVTRYTTDGSDPTAQSPAYSGPITLSTTTTVKFRSWDVAGNAEATKSRVIQVDVAPPTTTIACNGAACSSAVYANPVTVTLTATDTGGSGLSVTRFTTDGSAPTAQSPAYTGPFSVKATTTVKFRSWDVAGHAEATHSQQIRVR